VTAPSALGLCADPTTSDFGYVLGVARANAPPVQTQLRAPSRRATARRRPARAGGVFRSTR